MNPNTYEALRAKCRSVQRDADNIGVYSTGEQCAVALILNRPELFPYGYGSALEAVQRIGPEWFAACLDIQRNGWS